MFLDPYLCSVGNEILLLVGRFDLGFSSTTIGGMFWASLGGDFLQPIPQVV